MAHRSKFDAQGETGSGKSGRRMRISAEQKKALDEFCPRWQRSSAPALEEGAGIGHQHLSETLVDRDRLSAAKKYFRDAREAAHRNSSRGRSSGTIPGLEGPAGPPSRSSGPADRRVLPRQGRRHRHVTDDEPNAPSGRPTSPYQRPLLEARSRVRRPDPAMPWIYPLPPLPAEQQLRVSDLEARYTELLEPRFAVCQKWSDEDIMRIAEELGLDGYMVDLWYITKCTGLMLDMSLMAEAVGFTASTASSASAASSPYVNANAGSSSGAQQPPSDAVISHLMPQKKQLSYLEVTSLTDVFPRKIELSPSPDEGHQRCVGEIMADSDRHAVSSLASCIDARPVSVKMSIEQQHGGGNGANVSSNTEKPCHRRSQNQQECADKEAASQQPLHLAVPRDEVFDFERPPIPKSSTSPPCLDMVPFDEDLLAHRTKADISAESSAVESEPNDNFRTTLAKDDEIIVSTTEEVHRTAQQ